MFSSCILKLMLRPVSLYTGLSNSKEPPFALCVLQAALIHATPAMYVILCACGRHIDKSVRCAVAMFIVMLQVRRGPCSLGKPAYNSLKVWYLFQLPWQPGLVFFSRLPPAVRFSLVRI